MYAKNCWWCHTLIGFPRLSMFGYESEEYISMKNLEIHHLIQLHFNPEAVSQARQICYHMIALLLFHWRLKQLIRN